MMAYAMKTLKLHYTMIQFLIIAINPHLTDAFGIEPYNSELRPLYRPKKPWLFTVFTAQSTGPLYMGLAARSSSCTWVLTYSVGNVQQISSPPAIPPV